MPERDDLIAEMRTIAAAWQAEKDEILSQLELLEREFDKEYSQERSKIYQCLEIIEELVRTPAPIIF